MINARAETIAGSRAFARAFEKRRCLVIADGFYEWQKLDARRKQPWWIRLVQHEPFAFAGVWTPWKSPAGEWLHTCAIVTTTPNEVVGHLHDRMPVMLPRDAEAAWLDGSAAADELSALLVALPDSSIDALAVSPAVNDARYDGPECIAPVVAGADQPALF